ncbi:MAG: NAD-dependent epimerase/dehydratase family protein [Nanoarchaeota archaeon]|nr:NAD-dependent epimerase/dehydratase family protein [Nanoarchaeota archaeon]
MNDFVVVAGAGGFIGGHLVNRLITEGYNVKAVDIKPLNEWHQIFDDAENINLDLRDSDKSRKICQGINQVFNLAAIVGGAIYTDRNVTESLMSASININLLKSALKHGVHKYFFASSSSVYSGNSPFNEEDIISSTSQLGYGQEKRYSELQLQSVKKDLQARVARFSNVYGIHMTWAEKKSHLPLDLCRKVILARGSKEVEIYGDGNQIRDFIYVDDCVEGILKIMDCNSSDPINLGYGEGNSVMDLIQTVRGFIDYDFGIRKNTTVPTGHKEKVLDISLLKQITGWQPTVRLEEGMQNLYDWTDHKMRDYR